MKDLFIIFAIKLSKRKSQRQKKYFSNMVCSIFKQIGFAVTVQKVKHGLGETANIIIGDIRHAGKIIACGYDDPDTVYFPQYKYYPLNEKESRSMELNNMLVRTFLLILLGGVGIALWLLAAQMPKWAFVIKGVVFCLVIVFLVIALGKRNPCNFSKNGALSILAKCALENKNEAKVCYVLCDNMITEPLGLKDLFDAYPETANKKMVYLDRIGSGDVVIVVSTEEMKPVGDRIAKVAAPLNTAVIDSRDTDCQMLRYSKNLCYICSGKLDSGKHFYVDQVNTRKDSSVSFTMLEGLETAVTKGLICNQ